MHLYRQPQEGLPQRKVSIQKAETTLSFHPNSNLKSIAKNLIEHLDKFQDRDNPQYYNIDTLKWLSANGLRAVAGVAR